MTINDNIFHCVFSSDVTIEPLDSSAEYKPGNHAYAEGYDNGTGESM